MEKVIILTLLIFGVVKRVNIDLRKEIHSQAKIISILKNVSLNKYLEDCIEKALQDDEALLHSFTSQKRSEVKEGRQMLTTKDEEEMKCK